MKKVIYSMLAVAMMAFTVASCDDVPAPYEIPNNESDTTGGGGDEGNQDVIYFQQDFTENQGDWVIVNKEKPDEIEDIWVQDSRYGMKATAFMDNVNYKSDCWIISPAFSLKDAPEVVLVFEQAGNYFDDIKKDVSVLISETYNGNGQIDESQWTALTLDKWHAGNSWTFMTSHGNINNWVNKENLHIAFRYTSTEKKAGTWEIKNMKIIQGTFNGGDDSGDDGLQGKGTLENPLNVQEALTYITTKLGTNTSADLYVKGKISSVQEIETVNYGNASYSISDNGESQNSLGVYRGFYLKNSKFTKDDQIKVGDEVIIFGKLVNYKGNTPQFTQGNYIYSLNGKTEDENSGGTGGGTTGTTFTKTVDDDKYLVTFTNPETTAGNSVTIDLTTLGTTGFVQHQTENPSFTLDGVGFAFNKGEGSTTPKYWYTTSETLYNEFRMYAKNKLAITLPNENVHAIVLHCSSTYNGTKYTGNDTMTGALSEKTFTIVNEFEKASSGTQVRFSKVTITYAQ